MAGLLLDHNVASEIAASLRGLGHDVVSAREWHGERATDATHLLMATQQQRLLVTHDVNDFILLQDAWLRWFAAFPPDPVPAHAGILIIPQAGRTHRHWPPDEAARRIDGFLVQQLPLRNRLYLWTPSRGWVVR